MRPELVRVPRAFGSGGEAMEAAAAMPLGFDEAATISCVDLDQQTEALAAALPENPVVLGGCCCTHVGAGRGLARRHGRIAVVWVDAHGDLNTPETSPSGNLWGMPFRMLLDGGDVAPGDAALLGARSLDPPEEEYIDRVGLATSAAGLDRVCSTASAGPTWRLTAMSSTPPRSPASCPNPTARRSTTSPLSWRGSALACPCWGSA